MSYTGPLLYMLSINPQDQKLQVQAIPTKSNLRVQVVENCQTTSRKGDVQNIPFQAGPFHKTSNIIITKASPKTTLENCQMFC